MKEPTCERKRELLLAWQQTTEMYAESVLDLPGQIGLLSKQDYDTLYQIVEEAQHNSIQARVEFERHIQEHSC